MIELSTETGAILVPVKVVPGASRTRVVGEWAGRVKIAVAAAPEKGKANHAVVRLLADVFDVRRTAVSVVAGQTSPLKTIRIEGAELEAVRTALERFRS